MAGQDYRVPPLFPNGAAVGQPAAAAAAAAAAVAAGGGGGGVEFHW